MNTSFQEFMGLMLLILVACYDWSTTTAGLIVIFESNSIQTQVFCGVAALAFSLVLVTTFTLKGVLQLPFLLNTLFWSVWMMIFFINLFTTFVGNSALATDNAFKYVIYNATDMVSSMKSDQLAVVLLTTIFVVACTLSLSYVIEKKQQARR